ncbi:MAG: pilus assembly protein [Nocardioidaceae bacterium]|nr:pilus assembly protein [Nocardioidaceae bacterium]
MSTRPTRNRARDESGVIAVLVALMAIVLLGIAALAVDMGNAYARKRLVQTEVDLAALAGGAKLPATDTASRLLAVEAVLDYLQRNATFGQEQDGWTAAQLQDGSISNGEVVFESDGRMRVTAPPATVNFGLAGALGFSTVNVAAVATVEIRSPGQVAPLFLLDGCSHGSGVIKDGNQDPEPQPIYVPASTSNGSGIPTPTRSSVDPISAGAAIQLELTGSSFTGATTVYFTRDDKNWTAPALSVTATSLRVDVPDKVYNRPGVWHIRVATATKLTKDSNNLPVTITTGSAQPGCGTSSTGDFGLMQSPRDDVASGQWLELNIARGLDHSVAPFTPFPTTPNGSCRSGSAVVTGAILDYDPPGSSQDGANCVNIYTGNQVSKTTDGLLERLADSQSSCGPDNGTSPTFLIDRTVNNDVLSCFLTDGYSLGDVGQSGAPAGVISASVFDSPRFFWVPVLGAGVNPANGDYAIKSFRPVFITDESDFASHLASDASTRNGIVANNSQLSLVQVYAFSADALPATADATGSTLPYLGAGPRVVRLVE